MGRHTHKVHRYRRGNTGQGAENRTPQAKAHVYANPRLRRPSWILTLSFRPARWDIIRCCVRGLLGTHVSMCFLSAVPSTHYIL